MKGKYLIPIIFSLLTINVFSQNVWEEVFKSGGISKKIVCLNENRCYIVSTAGAFTNIHFSQDAGASWELLYSIKELEVRDMSIPDSNNIYIAFNIGKIYHSVDAGKTFDSFKVEGINHTTSISMYDTNIGVLHNGWYITHDGWESYQLFKIATDVITYDYLYPHFINDSMLYAIVRVYDQREPQYQEPPVDKPRITGHVNHSLMKLNINTLEYELFYIDHLYHIGDFFVLNEQNLYFCGKSHSISGGSGRDAIYKSTDSGKTWRRVLDLYYHNKLDTNSPNPFGLQSIAFKNSLTGIAVGQFGKIVYTYDGGESWTYENDLPPRLGGGESNPPTMLIRYSGTIPIIAAFNGSIHRLKEDNLAPGTEHKFSISGRIWEGDRGQEGVCVALGHRVTMTDKEGYYLFSMLNQGDYKVKVVNKYGPIEKEFGSYEPFSYTPLEYNIDLTSDTTGFDFNAEDLRTFYKAEGYIVDDKGQGVPDIFLRTGSSTTTTDESGKFEFPKIESRLTFDVIPYSEELAFSPSSHRINLITGDTTDLLFTATPATSVWESANSSSIILHPNPASEYIEINLENKGLQPLVNNEEIKIYNTLGECVNLTPSTSSGNENLRIDVSHLQTGLYFIRIGNKVEKFVKW